MKMYADEAESRQTECNRNVAKVLTAYTGFWSDELIFSEIEWVFHTIHINILLIHKNMVLHTVHVSTEVM